MSEIENMSDDSEEIQSGGLLKRYVERPDFLQNVTLADWAAWYDSCGRKNYRKTNKKAGIDTLPIENEDENNEDELMDNTPSMTVTSNNSKCLV